MNTTINVFRPIISGNHEWSWAYTSETIAKRHIERHYCPDEYTIREESFSVDENMTECKSLMSLLEQEHKALTSYQNNIKYMDISGVDTKHLENSKQNYLQARKEIRQYILNLLAEE